MVSLTMERCVVALLALCVLQTATAFAVNNVQTRASNQALMAEGSKRAKIEAVFRSVADKLGRPKHEPKTYVETNFPVGGSKFQAARQQPRLPKEEEELKDKYGAIPDVGERAYEILLDLGLVEKHGK